MIKKTLLAAALLFFAAAAARAQTPADAAAERAVLGALRPTLAKWLRGAPIGPGFQGRADEKFEPSLVDADGDGRRELAVRNWCAPVGNCQLRLFRKRGAKYETILKTAPGAVQTFRFKDTKTNGYFDLETKDHADAWSGRIEVYRFDGRRYVVRECAEYSYAVVENGRRVELKTPRVTPVECSE